MQESWDIFLFIGSSTAEKSKGSIFLFYYLIWKFLQYNPGKGQLLAADSASLPSPCWSGSDQWNWQTALNAESALQRFSLLKFAHRRVKAWKTEIKPTDSELSMEKERKNRTRRQQRTQGGKWMGGEVQSFLFFIIYVLLKLLKQVKIRFSTKTEALRGWRNKAKH